MELVTIILCSAIFLETTAFCASYFSKKKLNFGNNRRKVFVDTSVLIDGRILAVAKAGFLGDEILIPRVLKFRKRSAQVKLWSRIDSRISLLSSDATSCPLSVTA